MTLEEANEYIKNKMVCTDYPKQKTFVDISGTDVNYLHVIKYAGRDKYHLSYFLCQCVCGEYTVVSGYDLRHQQIKSCGCRNKEFNNNEFHLKHGDSKQGNISHLYDVWRSMRYRCYNPNHRKYPNYGGKGIKICEEWLDAEHGYENFKKWAYENGYNDNCKMLVKRIDLNGNYYPENCRWVTNKIQNNNKRGTVYGIVGNWVLPIGIWAEISEIPRKKIYSRLERGWNYKDAIFTPIGKPKGTIISVIHVPEKYEKYNKYDEFIKNNKLVEFYNPLRIRMYFKSAKY